jgi:hypothetical protein
MIKDEVKEKKGRKEEEKENREKQRGPSNKIEDTHVHNEPHSS